MKKPPADEGEICPLHKEDVSTVCHKCPWYIMLRGVNPNTGKEIDEWGCTMSWMGPLLVEVAKESRQGAAATESFRNAVIAPPPAYKTLPGE